MDIIVIIFLEWAKLKTFAFSGYVFELVPPGSTDNAYRITHCMDVPFHW